MDSHRTGALAEGSHRDIAHGEGLAHRSDGDGRDDSELRLLDRRRAQDSGGCWPLESRSFWRLWGAHRHQDHILNRLGFQSGILGLLFLLLQLPFQVYGGKKNKARLCGKKCHPGNITRARETQGPVLVLHYVALGTAHHCFPNDSWRGFFFLFFFF